MSQKKTCLAAQQKMATTITLLVQRPYLRRLPRILLPQKATEGHIIFHIGPFGPYICPITYPFFVYTYIQVPKIFVQKPYLRHLPRILLPQKTTSYFTLGHLDPIFAQLLTHFLFTYTYIWVPKIFVQKPYLRHLPRILLPHKTTSYFTLGHFGPIFARLLTIFI